MDNPEANDTNEVLSQSEVERLLAQVEEQEGSNEAEVAVNRTDRRAKSALVDAQPYDFRQPSFLSQNELRKLRLRHEEFIRSLASRFSVFLRMDFGAQMSKLHTLSYQKFIEGLPNPTYVTLFKAEPLRGICLLDIPPRLGLTLVDRLLGGPAHSVNLDREMSEIEGALLSQAVSIVLGEWCSHWHSVQELRPNILGTENNPRFLQSSSHDTVMLALSMEVRVGDCLEQMQFAFPCFTLEPLVQSLHALREQSENGKPENILHQRRWNPALADVEVNVAAEWQGLRLTAGELSRLKPGDVLPLSPQQMQKVKVRLANITKFDARLGTNDGRWAVELTNILKS